MTCISVFYDRIQPVCVRRRKHPRDTNEDAVKEKPERFKHTSRSLAASTSPLWGDDRRDERGKQKDGGGGGDGYGWAAGRFVAMFLSRR